MPVTDIILSHAATVACTDVGFAGKGIKLWVNAVGFAGKGIKLWVNASRMKQDWSNMNGSGTTTG